MYRDDKAMVLFLIRDIVSVVNLRLFSQFFDHRHLQYPLLSYMHDEIALLVVYMPLLLWFCSEIQDTSPLFDHEKKLADGFS